jgi:4-hydroxy-tetrahydrodipicolinate synthase
MTQARNSGRAPSSPGYVLAGVLPVFQTPFRDDEAIDFETLDSEIDWLFGQGASGCVMAMVSEVLRLATDEREALAAHVCRSAGRRGPVVISVGAESIHTAVRLSRHAEANGAAAVMAIPPLSVALGDEELLGYYRKIFDAVAIPIVVQDASGYVGRPMSIELQARILDEFGGHVYFKPEATPIGPRLTALREATAGRARVFEGSGGIALVDSYRRGIVGTMPGAEIVDAIVALWKALETGDERLAYELSLPISSLVALQTSLDAFLAIEKYLLVKRGIFKNAIVRGPVGYALDDETRREVDRLFDLLMELLSR